MPHLYSVLTTCKPSNKLSEFLNSNEFVRCCIFSHWPCVLLNAQYEIPKELIQQKGVELVAPASQLSRPVLRDFIAVTDAEWLIFANSDVWVTADWSLILEFMDQHDVYFASSRRWDLPEGVRASELSCLDKLLVVELRKISKRQSLRTLDVFVVKKEALEIALALNEGMSELIPGTVGFDNNLFGLMGKVAKTADLSSIINVFHTNHESFRKVFQRNHLISMKDQSSFIENRHKQRTLMTSKGCLSWADYRFEISGDALVVIDNNYRQAKYYIESVRVKLVNKLDNLVFIINKMVFNFIDNRSIFSPCAIMIFGVVVVYPIMSAHHRQQNEDEFSDLVGDLVNDKVGKWKDEHLQKICPPSQNQV